MGVTRGMSIAICQLQLTPSEVPMDLMFAAGSGILSPSLITIGLFVIAFVILNIVEKGRAD